MGCCRVVVVVAPLLTSNSRPSDDESQHHLGILRFVISSPAQGMNRCLVHHMDLNMDRGSKRGGNMRTTPLDHLVNAKLELEESRSRSVAP
jgi:hypothetical protein